MFSRYMNKRRFLAFIFAIVGILIILPYVVGITSNVIGINTTTKTLGTVGIVFIIIAAVIENIEEEKLHRGHFKRKSH